MRMYENAWQILKTKGKLRLAVPKPLHRRVIKAIMKEKDMDVGFKLEMAERFIRCRLEYSIATNEITITLSRKVSGNLAGVKVSDL